jgi:hypothetical protein
VSGSVAITNQAAFAFDASGNLRVTSPANQTISGAVSVLNFPATQPISATSLPLPTGAASEATLTSLNGKLPSALVSDRLKVDVAFPATQVVSGTVSVGNFPASQTISGAVSVSNFPATQAISATSLPLPTGAATETTIASISGKLPSALVSDRLKVDVAFPTTQTISGSVSVSNFPATQPISAASLPLPTGAASEASLASLNGKIPTALTSQGGLNVGGSAVDIVARTPAQIRRAPISVATSGDNLILAGVTGQKIKVLGMMLVANGDVNVLIKSATTNLTGSIPLASKGNGFVLPQNFLGYHWLEGIDAGSLILNLSAAIAVTGFFLYAQEP